MEVEDKKATDQDVINISNYSRRKRCKASLNNLSEHAYYQMYISNSGLEVETNIETIDTDRCGPFRLPSGNKISVYLIALRPGYSSLPSEFIPEVGSHRRYALDTSAEFDSISIHT